MAAPIPFRVVPSVEPCPLSSRQVQREFRALLDVGWKLRPLGTARKRPRQLLDKGYVPRARIDLFDSTFYLTGLRQNDDLRFFVAYVVQGREGRPGAIHPRVFYKDVSLVWRSASHFARSEDENWIGKGDVRPFLQDGREMVVSAEETTDLPLEIQTALETLCRQAKRIPHDEVAVELVLRRAPDDRIEPYRDFTGPRRRAMADPRNRLNRGRPIARFTRSGDPTSLVFTPGFEPDFSEGILEVAEGTSRLYGGTLRRYRIVSRNRKVQYLFFAGPRQVWIGSCQATTTELMSYGVRTVDVLFDDELLLPGYEYHFIDEYADPPELVSQIPEGFVGPTSEVDASRADASPWLDRVPVLREFRRAVLGEKPPRRLAAADTAARTARAG